ncbi:MAG: hypothetical protein ACSHX6_01870 [Akkermansiaceae bacterium]
MDYSVYKIIHYVGIFTLMFSLGSLFTQYNKRAVMGHGIALLLIILGGFGMQAKLKLGFPNWMIVKMVIWVIFGAAIVLAKRNVLKGAAAWVVMIGLAVVAAYLGFMKPF